jgi:hypothetical protein
MKYILIITGLWIFTGPIKSQSIELSGNYLTPGYTITGGYGIIIYSGIKVSAGISYLINNSYLYRGSNGNLLDAHNEKVIDRFRGGYFRIEEKLIQKPKYQLNLMQYLNYQQSDRDRPAVFPYDIVGADVLYTYERMRSENLYYLEYYLGISLLTNLNTQLQLRTSFGVGINRSPQYLSPDYKVINSQFAQHGGLSLIYQLKRGKNAK